jgi:hypothetical protein
MKRVETERNMEEIHICPIKMRTVRLRTGNAPKTAALSVPYGKEPGDVVRKTMQIGKLKEYRRCYQQAGEQNELSGRTQQMA